MKMVENRRCMEGLIVLRGKYRGQRKEMYKKGKRRYAKGRESSDK